MLLYDIRHEIFEIKNDIIKMTSVKLGNMTNSFLVIYQ